MKLKLEEKENKTIVGIFPGILDEVRHNIRDVMGENANVIAPNEDERKIIVANEKYAKTMSDILWFGEDALTILQNYKNEITDASAILYVIKGFAIYVSNRLKELDRIKKRIAGEQFYYYDDDGRTVLMGLNTEAKDDDEKIEDLSYMYNRLYSQKDLAKDTKKAVSCYDEIVEWVSEMMKANKKDLPKREQDNYFNIVLNARFINDANSTINSLLKLSPNQEEFKICQSLFINYNSFVERVYMECWAFKVNNNL